MISGIKGYHKMVINEIKGLDRVNRSGQTGIKSRDIKKLGGKDNWYKDEDKETPEESEPVLLLSHSKQGSRKYFLSGSPV